MGDASPAPRIVPALTDDIVLPFRTVHSGVMGRLVRLGPAVDTILSRHDVPVPVAQALGEGVAGQLGQDCGKDRLEVGDLFDLGPRKWVVVGIMKSSGSTFGSEIWAKRSLIGEMFGKGNIATAIVMRTANGEKAKLLADGLTKNFKKSAVQAQPESEYYSKLSATNQQFLYAIIFVAVVMFPLFSAGSAAKTTSPTG